MAQAGNARAKLAFSVFTGDLADSQQFNESRGVLGLLEGGPVNPNSGVDNAGCPPGHPRRRRGRAVHRRSGQGRRVEGPQFYDPDDPTGAYAAFPRWPGPMDRAQVPFAAEGLSVPSYIAFGNHDGLVQGNAFANRAYEDVGTGCIKPTAPAFNPFDPQTR